MCYYIIENTDRNVFTISKIMQVLLKRVVIFYTREILYIAFTLLFKLFLQHGGS